MNSRDMELLQFIIDVLKIQRGIWEIGFHLDPTIISYKEKLDESIELLQRMKIINSKS